MKHALIRLLHLFMVVLVLFSSAGFGLIEHSCQLRGKRVYSIHDSRPGCRLCQVRASVADPVPAIDRTACCREQTRYSKVDTTSSLSQLLVKFVKVLGNGLGSVAAFVLPNLGLGWLTERTALPVVAYAAPPPLSGRTLLAFVQSFLI